MADSPKCLLCVGQGKSGQTYKVAGKSYFKCHDCKHLYEASSDKLKFDEVKA